MKKLKIIIAIMIVIIILVITGIIILKSINPADFAKSQQLVTPGVEVERPFEQNDKLERVEYNAINSCVTNYIQTLNVNNSAYFGRGENGEPISILTDQEKNQRILNLLSQEYIEKNNITKDNLQKHIEVKEEQLFFVPVKIKGLHTGNVKTYVVQGITEDMKYHLKDEICLIVTIDYTNKTYSIEIPKEEYDNITSVKETTSIEKNENNQYKTAVVNMENIVVEYFNFYKRLALAKPELAYQFLEEEYKQKRFGSEENFAQYIENNKEEIKKTAIKQYLVNNHEGYVEYVARDENGNYYIFHEKEVLDFTFTLDTYTIPSEKFKTEYDQANDVKKVMMNIDKWVQMLNNRDYTSAYQVLDEEFRNQKFGSVEEFEKIMRKNYPLYYEIEFGLSSNENNTYIQDIMLRDLKKEENGYLQTSIMMQLKNNYNFVMSFEIE